MKTKKLKQRPWKALYAESEQARRDTGEALVEAKDRIDFLEESLSVVQETMNYDADYNRELLYQLETTKLKLAEAQKNYEVVLRVQARTADFNGDLRHENERLKQESKSNQIDIDAYYDLEEEVEEQSKTLVAQEKHIKSLQIALKHAQEELSYSDYANDPEVMERYYQRFPGQRPRHAKVEQEENWSLDGEDVPLKQGTTPNKMGTLYEYGYDNGGW